MGIERLYENLHQQLDIDKKNSWSDTDALVRLLTPVLMADLEAAQDTAFKLAPVRHFDVLPWNSSRRRSPP
jgi:hypothetical protein